MSKVIKNPSVAAQRGHKRWSNSTVRTSAGVREGHQSKLKAVVILRVTHAALVPRAPGWFFNCTLVSRCPTGVLTLSSQNNLGNLKEVANHRF